MDTTQGGDGVLEVSVKRNGAKVPVRLERVNSDGKYNVEFEPNGAGLYSIDVTFSGMVVRGLISLYMYIYTHHLYNGYYG